MKVSPITLCLTSLLFATAAFVAGRYTAGGGTPASQSTATPTLVPAATGEAGGSTLAKVTDAQVEAFLKQRATAADAAPLSTEQLVDALADALREADPVRGHLMFAKLMENLTPESAPEVFALLKKTQRGGESQEYMRMLAYRWGTLDPEKALTAMTTRGGLAKGGAAAALAGWASKSPEAAIQWLDKAPEGEKDFLRGSLVASIATTNTTLAADYAAKLPNGKDKHQAATAIFDQLLKTGGESAAKAWLDGLTDPDLKRGAFASMTNLALETGDVEAAMAMVKEHSTDDYAKSAASRIAQVISKKDVTKGLEFALSLPVGNQQGAFREVIEGWMDANKGTDSLAASEYVKNLPPGPTRDAGAVAIVREVVREDRNAAIAWANTIQEPEVKQKALHEIALNFIRANPEDAAAWLPNSGLTTETLNHLTAKLTKEKPLKKAKRDQ